MKKYENILCTICARGGSKGVENKNIKLLKGKPLIAYTIEQAKKSELFEHIVISTDSDKIADIAKKWGGEVFFKRKPELSNDTVGKLEVIKDAFIRSEKYFNKKFDYLIDLDVTSPLREVNDIIESFKLFKNQNYDNLFSVTPSKKNPYFNMVEINENNEVVLCKKLPNGIKRRQDAPKTYDMNASIYIWKRETILNKNSLFLKNTGIYIMPEERSIDIDTPLDFDFVEFLLRKKNVKK